ncbi:hypothetical protein [Oceanicoccus sp. KOV_DT_Chl]|uniref:hypothetical protein n=1 Tax=Oceanicoccus sp. KOV_DT_Chl TaxID=1904639 RepID=UPI000C7D15B9|nr:hypothetical protein [Oceanicoccus sp. KOV_DT_Chl]
MMKKSLWLVFGILALPVLIYTALFIENNRDVDPVEQHIIASSLEKATHWAVTNRDSLLTQNNAMLWWMIKRSAELSNDYRLQRLYNDYRKRYIDGNLASPWRPLFGLYSGRSNLAQRLEGFPDYNLYFIYGLTCDQGLQAQALVQAQMEDGFCSDHHPISPACVTHQLMGLQFRQQNACGDEAEMKRQVEVLQSMIVKQLTWDPRVVDVYLQRVLMLVDTGAVADVNPIWLRRIINQQLAGGGWSPFQPLLAMTGEKYFGFTGKSLAITKPKPSFHATAQGILLMTLLLDKGEASSD